MAASSPLPRWAPSPSPSRPLWLWGGGAPDAGWSLRSVFPWTSGRGSHRPEPGGGGPGDGGRRGPSGFDGVEVVAPPAVTSLARDDPGVSLTWEDVCVTVAGAGGGPPASILNGISGHARPGEVLAIMGPSGCGKTTLLDTLAGRLGPGMSETGVILINGRHEKLAFGTSVRHARQGSNLRGLEVPLSLQPPEQVQVLNSCIICLFILLFIGHAEVCTNLLPTLPSAAARYL